MTVATNMSLITSVMFQTNFYSKPTAF